jgi:hypothetical protein
LAASIDDLKIQLRTWFSHSEVRSCRRNANKVAHELAYIGKSCNSNQAMLWVDNVPASVAEVLVGDLPQIL